MSSRQNEDPNCHSANATPQQHHFFCVSIRHNYFKPMSNGQCLDRLVVTTTFRCTIATDTLAVFFRQLDNSCLMLTPQVSNLSTLRVALLLLFCSNNSPSSAKPDFSHTSIRLKSSSSALKASAFSLLSSEYIPLDPFDDDKPISSI
jgi:hypothetical protein